MHLEFIFYVYTLVFVFNMHTLGFRVRNLNVVFSASVAILTVMSSAHCDNSISSSDELTLFDFTKTDNAADWQEQSDTVRDVGMSKAVFVIHQNLGFRRAIFFVLLNPQANGAGFAGIRILRPYNLSAYKALQIKCRGQGQFNGFKVVLRHKGLNDEPNYSFEQLFAAPKEEFAVKTLPFSEFKAYYRGKKVNNETLDLSQITSIGLQMYGGVYSPVKQKGPATLEIDWIKAVP